MKLLIRAIIFMSIGLLCDAEYSQIQQICKPEDASHCYYLNRDTNKLSWYEADSNCKSQGYSLVSIPDKTTQGIIENMLNSANMRSDVNLDTGIWTGGTVSTDTTWRTLNLSAFTGVVRNTDDLSNFAAIRIDTGDSLDFGGYVYGSIKYPLCQIHRPDGCVDEISIGALCYTQLSETVNWYKALSMCEQYSPGATLAYTDVLTQQFTDTMANNGILKDDYDSWIGVYRRPWFWNKQYDLREDWIMRYYNWAPGSVSQGSVSNPQCVVISGDQDYKWETESCASGNPDYKYHYFLCEQDPSIPGTTPTTTTITATTTTTPSNAAAESSTENDDTNTETLSISDVTNIMPTADTSKVNGLSQENIIIIAAVVGLVVIIILVVIVVLLVIRRRKAKQKADEDLGLKDRNNDQVNANGLDNFALNTHDPDSIDDIIEPAYSTGVQTLRKDNKTDSKVTRNGETNVTYASVDDEKSANTKPNKEKEVKKQKEKRNKDKKEQKKNKDKKENKSKKSDISADAGVLYADVDRSNMYPKESNPDKTPSDTPEDLYADMPQVPTKNFDSSGGSGSPDGEDVMVDNQFYASKETNQNDAPDLYAQVDKTR